MELLTAQRSTYEVKQPLGDGLTSEVFKAFRKDSEGFTKQVVALKLIKSRKDVQILQKEFESLLRVNSKYCVKVLTWENFSKGPALVLEYIDGMTLQKLWQSEVLLLEDIMEILCQIRLGLCNLHRNQVFHGDLNLRNVMINKQGVVKLIDFGFGFEGTQCLTPEFASEDRLLGAPPSGTSDWVSYNKLFQYLVGNSYCSEQMKRQNTKARRRRQLAKKVASLCARDSVQTRRWEKTARPKKQNHLWKQVCSIALFVLLLTFPDSRSRDRLTHSLNVRSQNWFQYSINGSPFRYGPISQFVLRKGRYRFRWKKGNERGFRAVNLESNQTFLLNPE